MFSYLELGTSSESSSQDMTSQDSRVPRRRKPMDYYGENNEYYEDEVEDENLEEEVEVEEEDAWDDSALIAAWDSAVKEYQATNRIEILENFHSIKSNKTGTKNDPTSKTIPTSSDNKENEAEELVNTIKEDKIESFVQPDILDENEDASTSSFDKKASVKEQKQNVQISPEQKIKETNQIKPQTVNKSSTSGWDTSYRPQPSYPHHFPGYYSYPPPSTKSSTTPKPPHSFNSFSEQIKGTTDTQEEQEESKLPLTEEATTNYSNPTSHENVHDSYYSGEHLHDAHYTPAYGWSNYYQPPPPPPGQQGPPPQFYPPHPSSMPTDPNIPFPGQSPSKSQDMVPPMPGFDDEALTNLIMAWYYSGYYTGLYHGRKGR